MKTIYLDGIFERLSPSNLTFTRFQSINEIPYECDLIGITLWDGMLQNKISMIESLIAKTKNLAIAIPEPTVPTQFYNLLKKFDQENIKIFGNARLNFDCANYKTFANWFINPFNIYKERQWATKLLLSLNNDNKTKKFDCLLGRQKMHRDLISQRYYTSPCTDDIVFSYFKDDIAQGIWNLDISDIKNTADTLLIEGEEARLSCMLPVDIYNQTYYSIVAETTCSNLYSHFTEKTVKPIIARRPFIVFAGQYYLKNLQSLGFKTFDSIIDESYDNEADVKTRINLAWSQVEFLCAMDPQNIIEKIQTVLDYNYNHFFTTNWHNEITSYLTSFNGGECGIRTHGPFTADGFQDRFLKPDSDNSP